MNLKTNYDMSIGPVPKDYEIKTNLLRNRYITNGRIWTVDETIFNDQTKLLLVTDLKTRTILGYLQTENRLNEDIIIKLYEKILDNNTINARPVFVHSDMDEVLHSKKIQKFLEEKEIRISVTEGQKFQNQVSEKINDRIKQLVGYLLTKKTNEKYYRNFKKTLPEKLRLLPTVYYKCRNKEYRRYLFNSELFKYNKSKTIYDAVSMYNREQFIKGKGITREEAQFYDTILEGNEIKDIKITKADAPLANVIKNDNINNIKFARDIVLKIVGSDKDTEKKVNEILSLVIQRQDSTDELLQRGFIGLSVQNQTLREQLKKQLEEQLEKQLIETSVQNDQLKKQLEEQLMETKIISKRLEQILIEKQLAEELKQKRKNRNKLPRRQPLTEELYEHLINTANKRYGETYKGARLRLALALLAITGVRISELLPLKVSQIENLFKKSWIAIDRIKRGPANHKAFLTPKGCSIIQKRARDFEIIMYLKEDDSFVFTPQNNDNQPLSRQAFNRLLNTFITESTKKLDNKPNIKTYSFRIGFITDLWKNTGDIEFVRQVIGHVRLETTGRYIHCLDEEERKERMITLKNESDLFLRNDNEYSNIN